MTDSISVIIPNFNRSHLISRAIESVYAQTLPADEIIVIDDGSDDNSVEFISEKFPGIKLISQPRRGVSAARNKGIENAKGQWLAFLDSDDAWAENKLEAQISALRIQNDYQIAHTDETWLRNGQLLNQKKKHRKYGGHIFEHCLPLCAISPSSVIIRKNVFEKVGSFDESFPVCEDYDMWLRISCQYPVLFLPQALTIKHGGHEDQLSRKYWGMDRFRIRALAKILEQENLTETQRKLAVEEMLFKISIFLKGAIKHKSVEYLTEFETLANKYTTRPLSNLV